MALFANFNVWLVVFVVVMCVVLWFMPVWTKSIIDRLGATRVSEPEVKFIFFILFFLGGLATTAKSEAVLPAYLVGLVVAGVFLRDKTLVHRMRSIAFAMFTPFYFIRAGLYVSLPALWPALAIVGGLALCLKMLTKIVGVWPLARMHFMSRREAAYTTSAHGHRPDLRHDLRAIRLAKQDHRSAAIYDSRHRRDPERVCADALRAKAFPADKGRDARLGPAVSPTAGNVVSGRSGRLVMQESAAPPEALTDNHKRSISVSLQLLDKGLCEWEQWTRGHIPTGVMYEQRDNLSSAQKVQLQERIARVREIILRLRYDLKLEPARPGIAELIIGQATVLWEMLTELNSASLRGYGEVSEELMRYLDPIE